MGTRTQAVDLDAAPGTRQTGEGVQCPLTLPITGFRAQGRLSQLSARSGLYVGDKRPSRALLPVGSR